MNSDQVANILAYYSFYNPKEDVNDIAREFKLPPAIIVNALYRGVANGLFTATMDGSSFKRITVKQPPALDADYGDDVNRVKSIILEVVTNLNGAKEDITDDNLYIWLGAPMVISKVALRLLVGEGVLGRYKIIDEKDKKSIYTFYPLTENQEHHFGTRQFKKMPKKKDIYDVVLS